MSNTIKKSVAIVVAITCAVWMMGPGVVKAVTAEELQAQINDLLATLTALQSQLATLQGGGVAVTGCAITSFDRHLSQGMTGDDVNCLQIVLNSASDTQIAASGVGSPGSETSYFGPLTKGGVIKFQEKYADDVLAYWGLTSGTGYVGDTTIAKLNELLAGVVPVVPAGCECTDWEDVACGGGDCIATEMQQTRTCTPEEGAAEGVCEDAATSKCATDATCVVATGEGLTVALAADTPTSGAVPEGAQFVPYTKFNMSAGLEDVTVNTITITRLGQGNRADFDMIWLQVGDAVVSNHKSITSEETAILNLSGYVIPSGKTVTFTLLTEVNEASGVHASNIDVLAINSADDIDCDADEINGTFPVAGNYQTIVNYAISTATFAVKGAASTVDIGQEDVVLGEFSLVVASSTSKDGVLKTIRLKQTGTGGKLSYVDNLALYRSGDKVSTETLIDGEYVTFVMGDGYELLRGKTRIFEIRGNVVSGDDGDIIAFTLKKAYDLKILESGSTYGANVTIGAGVALRNYTLNAGKFSVSKDASCPANQEAAISSEEVVGLIAKVDLGQAIKVDGLDLYLHTDSKTGGGATNLTTTYASATATLISADIEDIRLYVNDVFIDSADDVSNCSGTGVYSDYCYDLTTGFELKDNDLIKVVFDIESTAVVDNIYKFAFDNNGASTDLDSPEYVASGESVATGDTSGNAIGNKVTIKGATVSHTRNDGYAAGQKFTKGTENAKLLQWVTSATTASDVVIKTLNFDVTVLASDTEYNNFTGLTLVVGGEVVAGPKDLSDGAASADGVVTFESVDYTVEAGKQAVFGLYSDVGDGASASTDAMLITLDVSDSTFYDAEGETLESGYYGSDVASATLDVVGGGTLTASISGNPPVSAILVAGSEEQAVAEYDLTAQFGAIDITDIYLANDFDGDDAADDEADARIEALWLVVGGEKIAFKVPASGLAHFNLGTEDAISIPSGDTVTIAIKADLTPITEEAQTNQRMIWQLYKLTTSDPDDVTNDLSATAIGGTGVVNAQEMVICKTAPVVSTATITDSYPVGEQDIFAFNVEPATSGSSLGLKKVIFDVRGAYSSSTTSIDDLTAVIVEGTTASDTDGVTIWKGSTRASAVQQGATIDISTNNKIKVTFDTVQTISGQKTFWLNANLENFVPEYGNYIQTRIKEDSSSYAAAVAWASIAASATFVWSDGSGTTVATLTDAQWINDRFASGLETRTGQLNY